MADYTDDLPFFGNFSSYYPTYEDMPDRVLRGYFTWRTHFRRGEVLGCPPAFVFVHAYEVLADVGVEPGQGGLRELIGLARAAGCRAVLLEVRVSNDAARALYARHGFTTAGRRRRYYTAPVEDALVMRLPLDGGSSEEGRGPSHLSDGGITK